MGSGIRAIGWYMTGLGLGLVFGIQSGVLNLQGIILMGTGLLLVSMGIGMSAFKLK